MASALLRAYRAEGQHVAASPTSIARKKKKGDQSAWRQQMASAR